jgi:single-strand selective monofunctional uracil DNA glycosylase
MNALVSISRELSERVGALRFPSVPYVYNPLVYAWAPHEAYLERWGSKVPRDVLMVGMNPGPFGMAQTGVPFGDVAMVRDFLGITGPVGRPVREHPRRPISGFACTRSEVSGTRLWGWARDRCSTADRFFDRVFVANWCPLVFMDETGRNRTPDKLSAGERAPLFGVCDEALARIVDVLEPRLVIGIGRFAERRAHGALGDRIRIGSIPHPSPASPAANRGCAEPDGERLRELGFEPRG